MKTRLPPLLVAVLLAVVLPANGQVTEVFSFNNLDVSIPDGNAAGLSDRRTFVSPIVNIIDLRVKVRVDGQFNGDLYVYLRQVNVNRTNFCVLLNRPGRSPLLPSGYDDTGIDVTFDDAASNGNIHTYRTVTLPLPGVALTGSWQPDGRNVDPEITVDSDPPTTTLSSFTNTLAGGEWTLFVGDFEAGGTHILAGWELQITGIARPHVTWPTPSEIVYGTPLNATQLNASSPVPGTFVYDPPADTVLNAGAAQTLTVTFLPSDTNSYVSATTNVSINVIRAATTGVVSSSANPALPGESVSFTFQVIPVPPGVSIPTGAVQFRIDESNFGQPVMLNAEGSASVLANLTHGLHTVAAEYAGDDNYTGTTNALDPLQLINTTPVANADGLQRSLTNGVKVLVSALLSNDLDIDGDAITFLAIESPSANGGVVTLNGNWVHYTPPSGLTNVDSFTYQIVDAYDAVATGTVFITNQVDSVPSPNLLITDLGDGSFLLRFDGVPGKTYRIEYTESLMPAAWNELGRATADTSGVFVFTDTPPEGFPRRYYRSIYP